MSNRGSPNNRLMGLAVLSFVVLGFFGLMNYSTDSNKVFGFENFYTGKIGKELNPKEVYSSIYKNTIAIEKCCRTSMTKATRASSSNGYTWIVDGMDIPTYEEFVLMSEGIGIKPYLNAESYRIVAPADLVFENANITDYGDGKITIRAYIGKNYLIEFKDVACWWCHIGKDNPTQHTEVIGAGGLQARCTSGYIIGEAKEETLVSLYSVGEDNSLTVASFSNLYNIEDTTK